MQKLTLFACAICCATLLPAQRSATWSAVYLNSTPRLDGQLNDSCWQTLAALPAFSASTPVFGQAAHCHTEVRLFYSDDALWVSAYCHAPAGGPIRDDRSARDAVGGADWFQLSLDTWNDDQQAFDFTVTAAGVQIDGHASGNNWNTLWQSAVARQSDGWSVELRIPYTALRFPRKTEQTWGLQLTRFDRSSGETSTWSPQNPLVGDRVWQFGTLTGIEDIHQLRRRATALHSGVEYHKLDEFYSARESFWTTLGVDQRLGLNASTTLDFTLAPPLAANAAGNDFSPRDQLVVGNAKLPEPRQLSAEEADLFERGIGLESNPIVYGANLLWRRPTALPGLRTENSSLLQATKLTTRTAGKWRLGVYNALLGPAGVSTNYNDDKTDVLQPLSEYNYLSAEYLLPNTGFINFSNSTLLAGRDMHTIVPTTDWRLRDRGNAYEFSGSAHLTIQQFDTTQRTGSALQLRLARVNRRWGWALEHRGQTNEYLPLLLARPDAYYWQRPESSASITCRSFEPHGPFLNISGSAGAALQWVWFAGDRNRWRLYANLQGLDRHFRQAYLTLWTYPLREIQTYENGGAYLNRRISARLGGSLGYSTDLRKRTYWSGNVEASLGARREFPHLGIALAHTWAPNRWLNLAARFNANGDFEQLLLLSEPGRWLFRRWDSWTHLGALQVGWYPVRHIRFSLDTQLRYSTSKHQEAVELRPDGQLEPVPYDLDLNEDATYALTTLGFQYFFAGMSQISLKQIFNLTHTRQLRERPVGYEISQGGQTQLFFIYWLDWSETTRKKHG